jgi:hypothetical protein
MASRVMSDTLRAPVSEQRSLRAAYSSSESRTLIIRDRGFRTVMLYSEVAGDLGAADSIEITGRGKIPDQTSVSCFILRWHSRAQM